MDVELKTAHLYGVRYSPVFRCGYFSPTGTWVTVCMSDGRENSATLDFPFTDDERDELEEYLADEILIREGVEPCTSAGCNRPTAIES